MALQKIGFSELQKAVYTRLTTDALTLAYSIYDYVPETAVFPYIRIGSPIGTWSTSISASDIKGQDNLIHIYIFSDYHGDKEVADMMDDVCQALDGSTLTITGYTPVIARVESWDLMPPDDTHPEKIIRQGIVRFRVHMA